MTKLLLLTAAAATAIFYLAPSKAEEWNRLRSPYPVFVTAPYYLPSPTNSYQCPKTPKPIHRMKYTSIYTDKSNGISIVDKAAQKKYRQQVKALKKYETQIYKWTEQALEGKDRKKHPVACALAWLSDWAQENSMLDGETNFQGEAIRKWTLASLSSLYLQIKNFKQTDKEQKRQIEDWLERLGNQVMSDYSKHPNSKSRNNNHMYWAAWSVLITAVAINNKDFYKWGLKQYKKAVNNIQDDGTLPLETYRQSKAFLYHIFAAAPLVMIAETATRNGDNMYEYNNSALHRLIALILHEMDNNQSYLRKKTGQPQNLTSVITPESLAWLEVYNARFKNKEIEKRLSQFRPMIQRRLGGNMTRLFAPTPLITQEKSK